MADRADIASMVAYVDNHGEGLTQWEIDFISDMIDHEPKYYSKKQVKVIMGLYYNKTK